MWEPGFLKKIILRNEVPLGLNVTKKFHRRGRRSVGKGSVQRRLAAIVVADVVSYSRLMEATEVGTLEALKARRRVCSNP